MATTLKSLALVGFISVAGAIQLNLYSDNACNNFISQINPPDANGDCFGANGAMSALLVPDSGAICSGFDFFGGGGCTPASDDPLTGLNYPCSSDTEEGQAGECLDFTTLSAIPQNIDYASGVDW